MTRPTITWAQVRRYFTRRGYLIKSRGGDKIIQAPREQTSSGKRNQVVIGHKCCNQHNAVVYSSYLSALHRAFGVTRNDILRG